MVITCPHRPSLFGLPVLGHVAWGYEYPDHSWCIGGVEGEHWQGIENGFWVRHMPDLHTALLYFKSMKARYDTEYDNYKFLIISEGTMANWEYADAMVARIRDLKYNVFTRNCMHSTYDVLRAFSNGSFNNHILPMPQYNWIPNGWVNAIQTEEFYTLLSVRKNPVFEEGKVLRLPDAAEIPVWQEEDMIVEEAIEWEDVDFIDTNETSPY